MVLLVPIVISFIFAGLYVLLTSVKLKVFMLMGIMCVCTNIMLSFIYGYINKKDLKEVTDNQFVFVVSVLTFIIPYSIYYVAFVLLLRGFGMPFDR